MDVTEPVSTPLLIVKFESKLTVVGVVPVKVTGRTFTGDPVFSAVFLVSPANITSSPSFIMFGTVSVTVPLEALIAEMVPTRQDVTGLFSSHKGAIGGSTKSSMRFFISSTCGCSLPKCLSTKICAGAKKTAGAFRKISFIPGVKNRSSGKNA
jgi:hypothetical protein